MNVSGDRWPTPASVVRVWRRLVGRAGHASPDELPRLAARAAEELGATELVLYLLDYNQEHLVEFGSPGAGAADRVPVGGTVAGRAFALVHPEQGTDGDRHHLWLPLVDGAERLGVCRLALPAPAAPEQLLAWSALADLVAALLVTRGRYGDAVERVRRAEPMQVAAEIVWSMLPPLAFSNPDVSVATVLEPCYEIGGDAFDYAVATDAVHLAMFDAVGHGIAASSLTALGLNAYRNARRTGLDLLDTYRSIDRWITYQFPDQFVTAIMCELDRHTGVLRYVNAAHPAALLIRDGSHIRHLESPTAAACGLQEFTGRVPRVARHQLQPGDHLLLYSDGVVEARSEVGFFGVERLADFTVKAMADGLSTAETLRRLRRALLDHHRGTLQDDATAMLLCWRPPA